MLPLLDAAVSAPLDPTEQPLVQQQSIEISLDTPFIPVDRNNGEILVSASPAASGPDSAIGGFLIAVAASEAILRPMLTSLLRIPRGQIHGRQHPAPLSSPVCC